MRSRVHGNGKPHSQVLIVSTVWLIGLLLSGAFVAADQAKPTVPVAPPPAGQTKAKPRTDDVTPVEGPSTLHRLGLTIEQTSIGSASWAEGAAPSKDAAAAALT